MAHTLGILRGEGVVAMRGFAIVNLLIRTGPRTVFCAPGKGRKEKDGFVILADAVGRPICSCLVLHEACSKDESLFALLSNKSYGKRLTMRFVRCIAKSTLVDIGFDNSCLTAHSMRYTAGGMDLMDRASLQQIQAMARHGSINATMVHVREPGCISNAAEPVIDELLGDT